VGGCRGLLPFVQTGCATGSEPGARNVYLSGSRDRPVRGSASGSTGHGRAK